jgi:hypothetical protein
MLDIPVKNAPTAERLKRKIEMDCTMYVIVVDTENMPMSMLPRISAITSSLLL